MLLADVVDFIDTVFVTNLIFGLAASAVDHDFRCAERVAAMDQRDFLAEAGEEVRLFHGRIAAADHHDLLAAIEEAVARRAGADAMADELLLGRQIQPAR